MQRLPLVCLLLALASVTPAWAQVKGTACDLPADLTTPSDPLARVAKAMATKADVDILALGSGSTVGESSGSSGPIVTVQRESSFPYRMVQALLALQPATRFKLTVLGGRNMTADMMLPIMLKALSVHHYDLVLWQTGTVEAVHGVRPDALRGVLQDGADATDQAGADLVLIDPQYSRFLRANADLSPYETVLEQMANSPGVTLFHRYDLTQMWVNSGQIDLERVDRDDRDKTIGQLNDCLGEALARFVLAGTAAR